MYVIGATGTFFKIVTLKS